jgi:hypothetical protein
MSWARTPRYRYMNNVVHATRWRLISGREVFVVNATKLLTWRYADSGNEQTMDRERFYCFLDWNDAKEIK